jgi:hypothetical protein
MAGISFLAVHLADRNSHELTASPLVGVTYAVKWRPAGWPGLNQRMGAKLGKVSWISGYERLT